MTETQPPGVLDHDHIAPPETDEELKRALDEKDFAKFFMWLKSEEKEVVHNPIKHAELLKRAAEICHEARDSEKAVSYLLLAAKVVGEKGPELKQQIVRLLYEFSGEEGLRALAEQSEHEAEAPRREELEAVKKEYVEVQQKLITLGAEDWKPKTPEQIAEIAELKERLNKLVILRAELMK